MSNGYLTGFGASPSSGQARESPQVVLGRGFAVPRAPTDATFASLHGQLNTAPNFQQQYRNPDWSTFLTRTAAGREVTMTANNGAVIDKLAIELRAAFAQQEFWIVNVPSSAEQLGHHSAWDRSDGQWVEPEYAERLRAAYRLLHVGVVRYIFVSGGKIVRDRHPDDNLHSPRLGDYQGSDGRFYPANIDAMCGRQFLLDNFTLHWDLAPSGSDPISMRAQAARTDLSPGHTGEPDPLEMRIIVDNYAMHTESNVHNCDRLCALLGLNRNLIATTFSKVSSEYGQGDGFDPHSHHTNSEYRSHYHFGEGSFHRLSNDLGLDGRSVAAGTGIFGNGSSLFTEASLLPHPFTAFAVQLHFPFGPYGATRHPEGHDEIGVLLHDKLNLAALRRDTTDFHELDDRD